MLLKLKENSFGQIQWKIAVESESKSESESESKSESKSIESLEPQDFWSIRLNDSVVSVSISQILDKNFPGWSLYTCSNGSFILSPKATTVIKPEGCGLGVAIIIIFESPTGKRYNLLMADNKTYIQNIQGGLELGEDHIVGIKREVMEEAYIDLSESTLVKVASYSFFNRNELIDCGWSYTTTVYFAYLSWEKVKHLFPNGILENDVTIVTETSLPFRLDETQQLFAIPQGVIAPEYFPEFKRIHINKGTKTLKSLEFTVNNQHRQLIEKFMDNTKVVLPSHFTEFIFFKRFNESIKEWFEKNK